MDFAPCSMSEWCLILPSLFLRTDLLLLVSTKTAISPFDRRQYIWQHSAALISSEYSFVLKDVESKDFLIKAKDNHGKGS